MALSPHRAKEVDFRTERQRFHETSTKVHGGPQRVEALQLPFPNVRNVRILRKSRIVVHSFPCFTVLEAKVLVRVATLHPERRLLSQEANLPREGIRPPFAFPDLGHLHLGPSPLKSRLVVVVVVLVVRLLLGKHGPGPRLLLQATRPDLDVRLLGALVLSLDQCRPESHVEVAPRTRGVVEL